jgi:hypothetical protein
MRTNLGCAWMVLGLSEATPDASPLSASPGIASSTLVDELASVGRNLGVQEQRTRETACQPAGNVTKVTYRARRDL